MSLNKSYKSPSTPGLDIDFFNFIVELVCLNMNYKLCPNFWRDDKYWKGKYAREISRGTVNLKKLFTDFDLEDNMVKIAIIRTIKNRNIKSLLQQKTLDRILRCFKNEHRILVKQKQIVNMPDKKIDMGENSQFVDIPQKTRLGRIREIESSG